MGLPSDGIYCPDDIVINVIAVNYTVPEVGVNQTLSCKPPPNTLFAENNITTVICSSTDHVANITMELCEFTVTVGEYMYNKLREEKTICLPFLVSIITLICLMTCCF